MKDKEVWAKCVTTLLRILQHQLLLHGTYDFCQCPRFLGHSLCLSEKKRKLKETFTVAITELHVWLSTIFGVRNERKGGIC